jgi:hypothetical protein
VSVLSQEQAEALEALTDERIGAVPDAAAARELVAELEAEGLLEPARREEVVGALERRAAARPVEWGALTTTQGEVLAAFARHCDVDLDDLEVVTHEEARLAVRWRTEESRFELRNGFLGVDRLATETPTMLLGDIEPDLAGLLSVFLDRPELRSRLAVCDLARLERLGTVRSSAFVYFEWFLRDAYGVKLVPVPAFTQGLIDRGVISLGMG